jgi:hypothetical protein
MVVMDETNISAVKKTTLLKPNLPFLYLKFITIIISHNNVYTREQRFNRLYENRNSHSKQAYLSIGLPISSRYSERVPA